jgi:primosomal protein N' (replication factor Y) (superfamily II helicase)
LLENFYRVNFGFIFVIVYISFLGKVGMFVFVRLLNGFSKILTYRVPDTLGNQDLTGVVVNVPLRTTICPAVVICQSEKHPEIKGCKIRDILNVEVFPQDKKYHTFINKISEFYFTKPSHFYRRIKNFLGEKPFKEMVNCMPGGTQREVSLTAEQYKVLSYVSEFINKPAYSATLLYGVTGSGKTEVYKKLIEKVFYLGKSTILMLPEVSLSLQFKSVLTKQLPSIDVLDFHSSCSAGEKKDLWNKLVLGRPVLILGVHLPVFLPISNLGLIIVDEEHDSGFQEKKHPKVNSKNAAVWRANIYNIPILLGSATPCVQSMCNVQNKKWKFFQLKNRFSGSFPDVKVVSLSNHNFKRRSNFWITRELENSLSDCLKKKEQAIVYLNRRGYCFFLQCKNCGFVFKCPNCSVSLTFHELSDSEIFLRCHYCDYSKKVYESCPECLCDSNKFLKKGIGTQQVVQILRSLFPDAVIEKADLDSVKKKKSWIKTVSLFELGKIDILVGTKTITKGYHFPNVTFVGILWADLNLHFPVFSAAEETLQQIIQVAGRAGRMFSGSRVVVQVMKWNRIFDYIDERKYLSFVDFEMSQRKECCYPPFTNLFCIELKNKNLDILEKDANSLVKIMNVFICKKGLRVLTFGPSRPIVHKIKNIESRNILLKSCSVKSIFYLLSMLDFHKFDSNIFVTPSLIS